MCTLYYNDSIKLVKIYKIWLKLFFLICHDSIHLGIQARVIIFNPWWIMSLDD